VRRGHRVVADGDLENRCRDVHRFNDRPRTVPGRPSVPSTIDEDPVLMGVEEDVRWSARSIVDRSSWDDHEGRWTRELNPDLDAYPHLRMKGYRYCCHEQRTEHESLHGLLHPSGYDGSRPVAEVQRLHPS
jgi:hypothetical protein